MSGSLFEHRMTLRSIGLALVAFVILGMADSGLGVAWPSMRDFMGRDLSELGLLLAALSAGYLISSSMFGRLERSLSLGRLLVIGASLLAASAIGLAVTVGWPMAVFATVVMGLGAGLIDVGMNAHAALEFDRGAINNLHAAYGVGATLGPILLTASLASNLAWRGGYAALAALQLGVAFAIWRGRARWAREPVADEETATAPGNPPKVAVMLLVFFIYTGVEVATGQWSFSLLTLDRGMGTGAAGVWVALYWGGLTTGRFIFGAVGERINASRVLDLSIASSLMGLALLWWDPAGLGVLGLPVTGVGFAAVFPTMVALTPARMGRVRSTRMIGYQLAAANLGAATIPLLLGLLAGSAGLGWLPAGLLVATAALGGLHLWLDSSRRGVSIRPA